MSSSIHNYLTNITDLLSNWLSKCIDRKGLSWLKEKMQQIAKGEPKQVFLTAFSITPRYTGKKDLNLMPEDLRAAKRIRNGWSPGYWSTDQVTRTLFLLALARNDSERYLRELEQLFNSAEVGELVALYQSLPLLPYPEQYLIWAAEGIRSNMTAVFNAIALRNPYPADYFDDRAWNQMVLKTVFVGSPLHLIWGLDRRANLKLAHMLFNYARERWAAKRTVTPELWRLVGPFVDAEIIADLERVFNDPDPVQRQAIALACSQTSLPQAQELLVRHPDLHSLIQEGSLTWSSFSKAQLVASI
jgi:hypothetical protein